MRSPRYSAFLLAFALTTISITFRELPTVEASTATPLALNSLKVLFSA